MIIIFLCLPAAFLVAQNEISGIVSDCKGGTPIEGVNVNIVKLKVISRTDSRGRYRLKNIPEGEYDLSFSSIGKETLLKRIKVKKGDNEVNVCMNDNSYSLAEVEVNAVGERKELKDIKSQGLPVSVIDGRTLAGRGTTIGEVINHLTGVKLRQTGGAGSQTKVNIRGLEGNRIQIYMDGYALNTPDGSFSINDIPLQFIDHIEVYKGIVPPEFGGDGLGGAINVVTISPEKGYEDLSYAMGSYGIINPFLTLRRYVPKLKTAITVAVGGQYAKNDYTMNSPFIPGLKIKRDHDRQKMLEGGITFRFMHNYFDRAEMELLAYHSNKQIQGIQTNIRSARTTGWSLGTDFKLEKRDFLVKKLDLKFYGMMLYSYDCLNDTATYLYDFYGNRVPNNYGGEVGYIPNLSDNGTWDYRYNIDLKYHLLPGRMFININNDFRYVSSLARDTVADRFLNKHYSGMKSDIGGIITSFAVSNNWLGDRLTSVFTGRHYYYSLGGKTVDLAYAGDAIPQNANKSNSYFGYSMALRYTLFNDFMLKLSLEHNYRLPRYEEALGDRTTTLTNTALQPEQANNYNFGVIYDHFYGGGRSRLQFESNVYRYTIRDMMYLTSVVGYFKYENLGKALLYGLDAELKWDINPQWYTMVNATWQKAVDNEKYLPGTNTPNQTYKMELPHIPSTFFNWSLDYRKDNLFGGKGQYTRFYYEGGYTYKYYFGFELSKLQDYKIPSTDIHTIGMEYGILNRKILFGIECHNIFNKAEMTDYNYPLAGRTLMAKIRFTTLKW